MKKLLVAGLAMLGSLAVAGSAFAVSVQLHYETGTLIPATQITGFSPGGIAMAGMKVTAYYKTDDFSTLTSETITWGVIGTGGTGGTGAGVQGTGWSLLFESEDTYYKPWKLNSTGAIIEKIVLDGLPGNTVFDIKYQATSDVPYGIPGTSGSARGWDFSVQSAGTYTTDGVITATYSNEVYLPNKLPVGDLFSQLTIGFAPGFLGSSSNPLALTFLADTDKMKAPIPEPATLLLFATGLAGLAVVGRRRRT